jgi:hypothetical protein
MTTLQTQFNYLHCQCFKKIGHAKFGPSRDHLSSDDSETAEQNTDYFCYH